MRDTGGKKVERKKKDKREIRTRGTKSVKETKNKFK
jgi:hypothetical protein